MGRLADLLFAAVFVSSGCLTLLLALAAREAERDTAESFSRAIALTPWNAAYRERAAFIFGRQGDLVTSKSLLHEAVRLEPVRASAMIELARIAEIEKEQGLAENWLLAAAGADHQFAPAWALANFHLRRGHNDRFWHWLEKSYRISKANVDPIWQLARRVEPDASRILGRLNALEPDRLREFLIFLRSTNDHPNAALIAGRLPTLGQQDLDNLLWLCDGYLTGGQVSAAIAIWQRIKQANLFPARPSSNLIENATFAYKPLSRCFDWRLPPSHDLIVTRPSPGTLQITFSGKQPVELIAAEQIVPLAEGRYQISWSAELFSSGTRDGLSLTVPEVASVPLLHRRVLQFTVPSGKQAVRIQFTYRRPEGSMRIEGDLYLRDLDLRKL